MNCEIDRDAKLTFREWVLGVLGILSPWLGIALVGLLCDGCLNVAYRVTPNEPCISEIYQPTRQAFSGSLILAWPQCMSDSPSDGGFQPMNLLTVPLGILGLGDTACEAVLDTVFLPYDAFQGK